MSLIAVLTILALGSASAYPSDINGIFSQLNEGNTCKGDCTYYGAGNDYAGTCQFGIHNSLNLPWATGNKWRNKGRFSGQAVSVALNSGQFDGSRSCGMCVKFRCWSGLGGDQPPKDWTYAIVNNLCPECKHCDLDIGKNGDGRWNCEWVPIACPVGSSKFRYGFAGSHSYYLKIAVMNTRVPVKLLEVKVGGDYTDGKRSSDNHFMFWGGGWGNPICVRVTSITGEVEQECINFPGGDGFVDGKAQFGSGGNGGSHRNDKGNRRRTTKPAPRIKTKKKGGKKQPTKSKYSKSGACKYKLYRGWQCGGKAGYCNGGTGCRDGVWKGGCCTGGTKCRRQNANYWFCK